MTIVGTGTAVEVLELTSGSPAATMKDFSQPTAATSGAADAAYSILSRRRDGNMLLRVVR